MKKYLLFLLVLCTVLSLCLGCVGNADSLGGSKDDTGNQSNESSEELSSGEESADIGSSAEANDSSEDTETTENPVSSEDDSNFTKEEAIAYFAFEHEYKYFTDFTNVSETATIPFSELEKWLDGISKLECAFGEEKYSIYELFDAELFHKPFTETEFYTIRVDGCSMNVRSNGVECGRPVSYSWTEKEGGVFYNIHYTLEGARVSLHVSRLSEYNQYYDATLGNISDYYKAMKQSFTHNNLNCVKIYNQKNDEYINVEVYCGEMDGNGIKYIDFIFNRYVFRLEFFEPEKSISPDDILNNIVIMDLLEEYEKIK